MKIAICHESKIFQECLQSSLLAQRHELLCCSAIAKKARRQISCFSPDVLVISAHKSDEIPVYRPYLCDCIIVVITNCETTSLARGWLPENVKILSRSAGISELCLAFSNMPHQKTGFLPRKKTTYTKRDSEAISMICQGFSTVEIARKNNVTTKTIEGRRMRLYSKAGAKNLAAFIQTMVKEGIYDLAQIPKT